MLEKLQAMAIRLSWAKWPLLGATALLLGLSLYILITSRNQQDDLYLIPAIILFSWSTGLYSALCLFTHIPAKASNTMPLRRRVAARLLRGIYYLFALTLCSAALATLLTSWQLLTAWRMMY